MTHGFHKLHLERLALLDPDCAECQARAVAGMDDNHMRALVGMTREEFDLLTDPSKPSALLWLAGDGASAQALALRRAQALLWAFRYAMRRELGLDVAVQVSALVRQGRWPLKGPKAGVDPWTLPLAGEDDGEAGSAFQSSSHHHADLEELRGELPQDPTGIDCAERYEEAQS